MSEDTLITLIKEVVKNEVKKQVKEQLVKMAKSGLISVNNQRTTVPIVKEVANKPKLKNTNSDTAVVSAHTPKRSYSKDPMLNEILNSTSPFSAQQRSQGGGSLLDMIQRESEDDWGTIKMNSNSLSAEPIPQPTVESTGNESLDILSKALNRDYTELVKRFK
jgi:hypothetical protein